MESWAAQVRKNGYLTAVGVATILLLHMSYCAALVGDNPSGKVTLDAIMPPYETTQEDEYLCTAVQLPDEPMKLVSVESLSEQGTVHHMLLFGCETPAQEAPVWPCRMAASCGTGGEHVLYGWGKNAPPVHLPDGTGYSVGPGTATKTVVLQVHYLKVRPPGDASGVRLTLTPTPQPNSAGLIAFASGFVVPPRESSHKVPNECCYSGFEPLSAFAFRVHTHALGREVCLDQTTPLESEAQSAVKRGAKRIVDQDPQKPQGFYPISPPVVIRPGDKIRATCDFNSSRMETAVHAGHTSSDEMCNLYLMVSSELPFFMWCVDNREWVKGDGAGGIPPAATAEPETQLWSPPRVVSSITAPSQEIAEGPPVEMPLGQVAGIVAGENGTVWALHRAFRTWKQSSFDSEQKFTKDFMRWPALMQLNRDTGEVLGAWGRDTFYMPHMLSIGLNGSIWAVDSGRHQVLKFSGLDMELEMELGQKLTPGNGTDPLSFCKPTHAVIARDGTIYVADGYCNSRIVILNSAGEFISAHELPSQPGSSPAPLPHSLALDECRRRLYVSDREIGLIHAFNLGSNTFEGSWDVGEAHGLPYSVKIGPYGTPMVLAWDRDRSGLTKLVQLEAAIGVISRAWVLEGAQAPHDFALIPAPLTASGAGDRLLSVLVSETAPQDSIIRKYVIRPDHALPVQVTEKAQAAKQPDGLAASHHAGHDMLKPVDGDIAASNESENSAPESSSSPSHAEHEEGGVALPTPEKAPPSVDGDTIDNGKEAVASMDDNTQEDFAEHYPSVEKEALVKSHEDLPGGTKSGEVADADYDSMGSMEVIDGGTSSEWDGMAQSVLSSTTAQMPFIAVFGVITVGGLLLWSRVLSGGARARRGYRPVEHAA